MKADQTTARPGMFPGNYTLFLAHWSLPVLSTLEDPDSGNRGRGSVPRSTPKGRLEGGVKQQTTLSSPPPGYDLLQDKKR